MNKQDHIEELKTNGETTFFDGENDEFGGWSETKSETVTLKGLTELFLASNEDVTKYFANLYQGEDVGAEEWLESIQEDLDTYIEGEIAMKCRDYYGDSDE